MTEIEYRKWRFKTACITLVLVALIVGAAFGNG